MQHSAPSFSLAAANSNFAPPAKILERMIKNDKIPIAVPDQQPYTKARRCRPHPRLKDIASIPTPSES
jgi:hypothetical protein